MLLLDTCTLLWLVGDKSKIPPSAISAIDENREDLFVSAVSILEIGIKVAKGRLALPLSPLAWYERALQLHGLEERAVDGRISLFSTELPPVHADPFDRILIATARLQNLTILTPDPLIQKYPDVKWAW